MGPESATAVGAPRKHQRRWVMPVIIGVLTFVIGVAAGAGGVETVDLDAEVAAAVADLESERDALTIEVDELKSERDDLASELEAVSAARDELEEEIDDLQVERDEALALVETVESDEADAGSGEGLREIQVLALSSVLADSAQRDEMCDAWRIMGDDATAAVVNSELEESDKFPVDVVAEVFADACG